MVLGELRERGWKRNGTVLGMKDHRGVGIPQKEGDVKRYPLKGCLAFFPYEESITTPRDELKAEVGESLDRFLTIHEKSRIQALEKQLRALEAGGPGAAMAGQPLRGPPAWTHGGAIARPGWFGNQGSGAGRFPIGEGSSDSTREGGPIQTRFGPRNKLERSPGWRGPTGRTGEGGPMQNRFEPGNNTLGRPPGGGGTASQGSGAEGPPSGGGSTDRTREGGPMRNRFGPSNNTLGRPPGGGGIASQAEGPPGGGGSSVKTQDQRPVQIRFGSGNIPFRGPNAPDRRHNRYNNPPRGGPSHGLSKQPTPSSGSPGFRIKRT